MYVAFESLVALLYIRIKLFAAFTSAYFCHSENLWLEMNSGATVVHFDTILKYMKGVFFFPSIVEPSTIL